MFTLKEDFMSHLLEEPVDDITWLRIKQLGTYTIHFDLICDGLFTSFSFEFHTRDEIIHFSEHNPKHDINPSDFTTVFDRPIVLGGNQRYVIGLDKVNTMTYSWHNVSPDYQNK